MIDISTLPIVVWPISCFDRSRENPLPVYNRWYWLDWSTLSPEQVIEVLTILQLQDRGPERRHSPEGFDDAVVTMSIQSRASDTRLLEYRQLFAEIPDNDIAAFMEHENRRDRGFRTVRIGTEYFEDDTGTPITHYEMTQHVTGQEFPIIAGDSQSILRLGPASPVNASDWDSEKANTLAQFLDVVQRIAASQWIKSPVSMTSRSRSSGVKELLEATFPSDENTMSVLAYFRQLHAGDQLLLRSVDIYLAHCADDRKCWWINERKQSFETLVDSPPVPYDTDGKTRRQIIRMFMYGAGLLHSGSQHGDDNALNALIAKHGQHKAVIIFHSSLLDVFSIAVDVYHVVRQEFHYWINDSGLDSPTRFQISELFASYVTPKASSVT